MAATPSADGIPHDLPKRGIKPIDSLRSHTRLAILVFLAVLLAGVPVAFLKGTPKFQATATVHVAARYMKNLKDDSELDFQSNSQYRQFVEQQVKTINRFDIIEHAFNAAEAKGGADAAAVARWRRPAESERRAIERLQGALRIVPVPDTYLVQISLEGGEKEGLAELVNAVVESYLVRSREEQMFGADERVVQLKAREEEVLTGLRGLVTQRSQIARELGVTAFNAADGNPFDKLAQKLREDLAEARKERFDAEARLGAFEKQGETDIITRSVQENVLADPGLNSLKANLNKRRADLVTAQSGLSPEHPGYQAAADELAEIDAEIARHADKLGGQVKKGLKKRYLTGVDQAKGLETELARELEDTSARSEAYAARFNEAVSLTGEIEQAQKELDSVRERLNFFAAERNSQGFVRSVTPALPPEMSTGTGKKKLLMLVIVAAFGAGLAAPVLRDLLDRRVRTVNDAHRALGFAPLGWLIERTDGDSRRFGDDQLRRLASALVREQDRNGTRAIAFTSAKPGGGTTRLVQELARTLNELGFPALAVEANAYKPDAAFGNGPGLADLLADPSARPAIVRGEADLPMLPVGTSGRALGGLERLGSVLDGLGADYRFVLIDAPPLLTSSDSELVIRASGAVVLVVEAEGVSRGEIARAGQVLEKLAPPSVGAVVNRVAPFHAGGYVQGLVHEYMTGRKQGSSGLLAGVKSAAHALVWDAAALTLSGLWKLRGRRRSRPAALAQGEKA